MGKNKKKIIIAISVLILGIVAILIAFKLNQNKDLNNNNNNNNPEYNDNNQDNNQDNDNDDDDNSEEPDDNPEDTNNQDEEDENKDKDKEEETKPDTDKPNTDNPSTTTKPEVETYTLNVYKDASNKYCIEKSNTCSKVAFAIKADTNNAKVVAFDDNNLFLLYSDNGLKLYDIKKSSSTKLNLGSNISISKFILSSNKDKVVGLIYKEGNSKYYGYYNINSSKKFYENKYVSITESSYKDYLFGVSERVDNITTYALLKANENKVVISDKDDGCGGLRFTIDSYNGANLYKSEITCMGADIKIFSNTSKLLETFVSNDYYSIYNGNLYVNSDNIVKKYDYNGNIISSNNLDGVFKQIINNNVIYVKDNSLMIQDINTKNSIKVDDWDNENYQYLGLDSQIIGSSGYYSKDKLASINKLISENVTSDGIYLVVSYKKSIDNKYGIIYFYKDNAIKKYLITKTN